MFGCSIFYSNIVKYMLYIICRICMLLFVLKLIIGTKVEHLGIF